MNTPIIGIVTGAAGAIGKAIAIALAESGANLIVTDLDQEALDKFITESSHLPGKLVGMAGNMLDPELGRKLVARTMSEFGTPNLLVNCSGLLLDNRIQKMSVEKFRLLIDINLTGPLRLIDAVAPVMRDAGYGRIISLSSRAWLGNFGSSGYSSAKGGVVGASRSLALAFAPHGITVNCIAPGFIDTPMARSMPAHILDRVVRSIPVGRTGTVDDVSALVKFLANPASGYITGQTLVACGGRSISNPIAIASKEKHA